MKALLLILPIVIIAGCIGQAPESEPLLRLRDGDHCIEYAFKTDIHEIGEIPIQGKLQIQETLLFNDRLNIQFEPNEDDNSGFALAAFAISNKLTIYNIQVLGRFYDVGSYELGNETGLAGANLTLRGPNTGAVDTSVRLEGNTIIVQGLTNEDVDKAGERLALVVLEDLVDNTAQESLYLQRCQV